MNDWIRGIKKGLPIAIGYLSVSFTFGVKAVNAGIPVWITILISVANVTSAGQFAGVAIMAAHGSYLEMAMTTFIINVRYMLMSFSLSQKVDKKMTLRQRLMIGYGITDEIFAVSSMETESLSARFMYGLITVPVFGWTVGTAAGALASQIMPGALSAAMELGLYAMFIAIIIPPAKKSKAVLFVIGIAVICQCIFTATPVLKEISIGFQVETAAKEIPAYMKGFSVDLYELQNKYCSDRTPYVIPGEPAIEHIFSELYNVPVKIKKDYFKIKVLELLLYLDALELSGHTEERPYFYKGQVEKIKAIQSLLTQDLTKNYTLEELSAKFDIALTPMKNCFKSVYGSPIFTYMRNYRMNYAAALLKSDKSLKVADVAGLVGYDSPSKFTAAFHQTMGKTPLEYRKSII